MTNFLLKQKTSGCQRGLGGIPKGPLKCIVENRSFLNCDSNIVMHILLTVRQDKGKDMLDQKDQKKGQKGAKR